MPKNEIETEVEREESADEIQAHIKQLQEKLIEKQLEEEPEVEKIRLPLGNAMIKIERGTTVIKEMITPPELQILVAEHHKGAGGMPVQWVKLAKDVRREAQEKAENEFGKSLKGEEAKKRRELILELASEKTMPDFIEVDPRGLRNLLCNRYNAEKVNTMFPGSEPVFPKTFRRAMSVGIEVQLPSNGLFELDISKHA